MSTPEGSKSVPGSADTNGGPSTIIIDPELLKEAEAQKAAEAAAAATASGTKPEGDVDDEARSVVDSGKKRLTYALTTVGVLGVLALLGLAFLASNGTTSSPTVVERTAPASPVIPAVPAVRTVVRAPALRAVDGTGCRRRMTADGPGWYVDSATGELVMVGCAVPNYDPPASAPAPTGR